LHVSILVEDRKDFQMKFSKYVIIDGDFLFIGSVPGYFTLIKPCCIWDSAWGTVGRERGWKPVGSEGELLAETPYICCSIATLYSWSTAWVEWIHRWLVRGSKRASSDTGVIYTYFIYIYIYVYVRQKNLLMILHGGL